MGMKNLSRDEVDWESFGEDWRKLKEIRVDKNGGLSVFERIGGRF
jgi:hypothetical protein